MKRNKTETEQNATLEQDEVMPEFNLNPLPTETEDESTLMPETEEDTVPDISESIGDDITDEGENETTNDGETAAAADIDLEEEVPEEEMKINVLLFEGPVQRQNPRTASKINSASERALTGRRPSMREPRKQRVPTGATFEQAHGLDVDEQYRLETIGEDKALQQRKMQEMHERKKTVDEYFSRQPRQSEFDALDLDEEIQVHLNQEQLIKIISHFMNQRYKTQGFIATDDLHFGVSEEISQGRTTHIVSLNVKMKKQKIREDE